VNCSGEADSVARITEASLDLPGKTGRRVVAEISGHSTRVGAAQDLAELDIPGR
jgi:hypothetical protein